ncbi:GGDEF domain-containing protein [Marinobacter pelagius]|uniref:GGDEF domain-containing protein n=1 Tax=Marinobacter sp. C7 TaxID=2951363 RepID=UPI001EEF82DD|nr:GGDEF domain-containing protein [Marinobacter sp. C7]MCG7200719.1 GGDEF domain-containing protein [Marinobacter sp. C7]
MTPIRGFDRNPPDGGKIDHRRATVAYFCLVILAATSLVLGLINLIFFQAYLLTAVEFIFLVITLAALFDLQRHQNVERAAWVSVLSAGGLTLFFFYYVRGDFSASVWAVFFVMINFFLLGTRRAVPTYVAFLGLLAALIFANRTEWPAVQGNASLVNIFGALTAGGVAAYCQERSRESAQEKLQTLADRDFLTGISNRRHFIEIMTDVQREMQATGQLYSLLLVDIDNFKQVNDVHGHAVGDEVIIAMTRRLTSAVRAEDLVGRLGGEEFAVLLRVGDRQTVQQRAEAIRMAVAKEPFTTEAGQLPVTISVGVATGDPDSQGGKELFAIADRHLYMAKAQGRNRVVMHDNESPGSIPGTASAERV